MNAQEITKTINVGGVDNVWQGLVNWHQLLYIHIHYVKLT